MGAGAAARSSTTQVVLNGTVLGVSAVKGVPVAPLGRGLVASDGETIVVTVLENTAITTTLDPSGAFTLRGVPTGTFTLAFSTLGGTPLGTLTFDAVRPNQQITITVDVSSGTVVLLDERRVGIGHGDIEIEGLIEAVIAVDPEDESRFQIAGYLVLARPGETAIRKGGLLLTVTDLAVGQQVHVKGVWEDDGSDDPPVLAHAIVLQDPEGDGTGTCMIAGGKVGSGIQLEGDVSSGSAERFLLEVGGNRSTGLVDVDAGAAEFKCSPAGAEGDACKALVVAGAKVHVSGILTACSLTQALVTADQVKVQKK
jgi:hypothetical protein